MLRSLLHPLLVLLLAGSGYFAYTSDQAARPVTLLPTPVAQSGGSNLAPQSSSVQAPAPPVTSSPLPDVDAVVVLDNSGSMSGVYCESGRPIGVAATDAEELRVKAAQVVIAGLAADLEPRQTSLGIVTFGTTAELLRQLTPLSNDDASIRDELSGAVDNPKCMGDTNIVEALQLALNELKSERATPGNTPVIIFLTDGENTVGNNSDIERLINTSSDVQMFVVLLGEKSGQTFWKNQGQSKSNLQIYTINTNDQLPELYRDITAELNFTPNYANAPALPAGQVVTVTIPPNVKQVVFTAIKRLPKVSLGIQAPDGSDARALPPDQFRVLTSQSPVEVFVIDRPAVGDWVFQVPDGETVTVLRPEFKSIYQVQLLQPNSASLLGVDQPTDIVVQVVDIDSQMPLAGTFTVNGVYSSSDGTGSNLLTFQPANASPQYVANVSANSFVDGQTYRFTFDVSDDRGLASQPSIYQIGAGLIPTLLSVTVPSQGYVKETVQIAARVANSEVITGQATLRLVQNVSGVTLSPFRAVDATNYSGELTFDRPGNYTFDVAYSGTTRSGRPFNSVRSFSLSIAEPIWQPIARGLATLLATLIALYFLLRFVLLRWLIQLLTKLKLVPDGYIRITPPGQRRPLPEQRIVDILISRRKLFRVTIGFGPDFDIEIQEDPAAKVKAPTLYERLFGRKPRASVRVRNGKTVIEVGNTRRTFPQAGIDSIEVDRNTIEFSLESMDRSRSR